MKAENVYIGNILICTKYQDRYSIKKCESEVELYKENAILIKSGNQYADLDSINNDLDLLKTNKYDLKTFYSYEGDKFVDENSLRKYRFLDKEKVNVKTLKTNRNK